MYSRTTINLMLALMNLDIASKIKLPSQPNISITIPIHGLLISNFHTWKVSPRNTLMDSLQKIDSLLLGSQRCSGLLTIILAELYNTPWSNSNKNECHHLDTILLHFTPVESYQAYVS